MVALQRLLYGPLRPIEIEQLYEKAWFAITETCLAMTIFRDEVGGWFLVMFVALLMGKVWGWIGEGRVEVLEQQPPANPRLFHARLSFSLLLSMTFDLALLRYAVNTVLQMARPNMMVMFAFEFAVLTISSSSTSARYAISLVEAYIVRRQTQLKLEERRTELRTARAESRQRTEPGPGAADAAGEEVEVDEVDIDVPGWEDKGQWVLYLDLVTGKTPQCHSSIVFSLIHMQTSSNLSSTSLSFSSSSPSMGSRSTSCETCSLPFDPSSNGSVTSYATVARHEI